MANGVTGIIDAVRAINPTAILTVSGNTYEGIEWLEGTAVISKEDVLAKQVELDAEYDTKQYQRDRQYPSWQDQLDMQYHDQVNDTTTWKDAIQAVKDANPKA